MTIDEIKSLILSSGQALADTYATLHEATYKTMPAQGGWPAAGVVGHLHMSESGILRILSAPGAPVERDPLAKKALIESGLSPDSKPIVAPPSLEPDLSRIEFADRSERLLDRRKKIVALLDTQPLDEECIVYNHPFLGVMTRPEWGYFVAVHGERHRRQLERIVRG